MNYTNSIMKYLKKNNGSLTLATKSLTCRIPEHYVNSKLAIVDDKVRTLGIMEMIWNDDEHCILKILGTITMVPSTITSTTIQGMKYFELKFVEGDTVVEHTEIIKDSSIGYNLFNMFITHGKVPYFMSYETMAELFDTSGAHTGSGLNFSHIVFELLTAKISKDRDGKTPYRLTDMKNKPIYMKTKDVSGAESGTAKLLGSYFGDAINVGLLDEHTENSDVEDLLRI